MSDLPIALTVAGTDPTGGAGVFADLKAMHSRDVYGMAAVTSLTAQNTMGVQDVYNIPADFIDKELNSIFSDEVPHAMKTGMLAETDMMFVIAEYIRKYNIPYVMDPVMIATSGDRLMTPEAMNTLIETLIPLASVVAPNLHEAAAITGMKITEEADIHQALKIIVDDMQAGRVIIKGGHLEGDARDYLYDGQTITTLSAKRIQTNQTHGTGCTFSAVLTAELAKGRTIQQAFKTSKAYITNAIEHSPGIGRGNGPVNHFSYKGE